MMTSPFDKRSDQEYAANKELRSKLLNSKTAERLFTISDAARLLRVNHSIAQGVVKRMAADGLLEVVRSRNNRTVNKYRRAGLAAYWLSIPWRSNAD